MGDAGAAVWSAELDRTGRVVFPQRTRRVLFRLVFVVALVLRAVAEPVWRMFHDSEEWWDIVGLIAGGGFLVMAIACVWQLVTRRPVLTVDREGIRIGRRAKHDLRWSQIGSIGTPTGPALVRSLAIQSTDRWAYPLTVGKDHVLDLAEFSHWLRTLDATHPLPTPDQHAAQTPEPS
ncbi:MAG TPA: hypothetical protein VFG33_18580 [Kribbella sp.]|uniref:hypothetical protein n=1 Tax=Kribbella sp. TaxID=1871183 RepID=UPI002D765BAE|nr:hypothetical protein [Kribbella sp.]HET6295399.1 hypothetical protein [Kribbella sp.]